MKLPLLGLVIAGMASAQTPTYYQQQTLDIQRQQLRLQQDQANKSAIERNRAAILGAAPPPPPAVRLLTSQEIQAQALQLQQMREQTEALRLQNRLTADSISEQHNQAKIVAQPEPAPVAVGTFQFFPSEGKQLTINREEVRETVKQYRRLANVDDRAAAYTLLVDCPDLYARFVIDNKMHHSATEILDGLQFGQ